MEEIWPIYLKYMKLRTVPFSSIDITINKESLKSLKNFRENEIFFCNCKKKSTNPVPLGGSSTSRDTEVSG